MLTPVLTYDFIRSIVWKLPIALELARSKADLNGTDINIPELVVAVETEAKRRIAAEEAKNARCKATTTTIAHFFAPVRSVGRQIKIAASYLWALVKARKAGWCPYLTFHD